MDSVNFVIGPLNVGRDVPVLLCIVFNYFSREKSIISYICDSLLEGKEIFLI